MLALYSAALALALVAGAPWFLYQALRRQKYLGSLRERLGALPVSLNLDGEPSIWIHAVSVGEVLAARPLVNELKARYPGFRMFVSTTTSAGQQLAKRHIRKADAVFYFPIDFAFIVRRVLDRVRPRLLVLMEGEIWPNVLAECRRREVKTAIVNGRISVRSFPRYRLIRPLLRRVLGDIDAFCMQSEEGARRIVAMGAEGSRVSVTGSLKFDAARLPAVAVQGRPRDRVLRFFRLAPQRPVIVAGSTMRGEELPVLRAFRRIKATSPQALLVIAPRHADRFGEVWTSLVARASRSAAAPSSQSTPSRALMSSCSIRSASSRSSIKLRPSPSWAAALFPRAATTSSSLQSTGVRSCSARRCPTSRKSPTCFSPMAPRCSWRTNPSSNRSSLIWSLTRCGAPASARRRARWSTRIAARPSARWR